MPLLRGGGGGGGEEEGDAGDVIELVRGGIRVGKRGPVVTPVLAVGEVTGRVWVCGVGEEGEKCPCGGWRSAVGKESAGEEGGVMIKVEVETRESLGEIDDTGEGFRLTLRGG